MTVKTDVLDQFAALSRSVQARFSRADRAELEQVYQLLAWPESSP